MDTIVLFAVFFAGMAVGAAATGLPLLLSKAKRSHKDGSDDLIALADARMNDTTRRMFERSGLPVPERVAIHYEGTAMKDYYSPNGVLRERFVKDRGWVLLDAIRVGDLVSNHAIEPEFRRVTKIERGAT